VASKVGKSRAAFRRLGHNPESKGPAAERNSTRASRGQKVSGPIECQGHNSVCGVNPLNPVFADRVLQEVTIMTPV
jgi:hypothetical protein